MTVDIDSEAGFCFGVVNAIEKVSKEIGENTVLYCLGEIVHNEAEQQRLEKQGMKTIGKDEYRELKNEKVFLRAHGEPPSTYKYAKENNIQIIDGTCPIVLSLQKRIKKYWQDNPDHQVIIYGKNGHPEVTGLNGQIENTGIIVSNPEDLNNIDYSKHAVIYSQTTMGKEDYEEICNLISENYHNRGNNSDEYFVINKSVCGQVANRKPSIKTFAESHDVILFVAGTRSSNGKMLYEWCKKNNSNTYLVNHVKDIQQEWFTAEQSVGITGATSTPQWQMEEARDLLRSFIK